MGDSDAAQQAQQGPALHTGPRGQAQGQTQTQGQGEGRRSATAALLPYSLYL